LWATAAALVLIVATTAGLLVVRSERAQAEPASLAVLPFKNMAAGSPYFAEGVAEEIADRLSREPQFKVAGRTSSDLFKNAADVQDVGRRLHVAYVLEGSVRSAGNQVRVDVALVDTRRGMRLWNQDFSGSLDDIFGIQDSIGQQVAAHLKKELIRQAPLAGTATTRGDVYSLYVTARALTKSREPAKLAAATDLLRQAVQLDPNYAPAWAQLALTIDLGKAYGHPDEPPSARSHQEDLGYAQRAISLAPGLGEAHAIYGLILGSDTLDADALRKHRQELETAVKLDPNDAYAWYWLSGDRRDALDFEGAESALRHTATIDPFFLLSASYADTAWDLGDRADALRFLKDRIANHPDPYGRYWGRLQLAGLQNNLPAAYQLAKAQDAIASPDQKPLIHGEMASILLQLGLFDQAAGLVPKDYIDLRRSWKLGRYDPVTPQSARDFWLNPDLDNPQLIPRLWVKEGHSSYLVSIYDHAFSSPEDMVSRFSHYIFMDYAPLLAIGLQQAGRHAEGMRILTIADSMCAQKIAHGRTPISFRVGCSRVAALMGRKDEAVHALEQAFHEGWRPGEEQLSRQADEPANVLIRDDPRLKRIDAEIVRELAAQRRQLLAAGL
jgi:TolB-like protein/tetratricopeptide (TPR) repeat protein